MALLEKVKDPEERLWYAQKTVENGWSRNVLVLHIERELFEAKGSARANFETTLAASQSGLGVGSERSAGVPEAVEAPGMRNDRRCSVVVIAEPVEVLR